MQNSNRHSKATSFFSIRPMGMQSLFDMALKYIINILIVYIIVILAMGLIRTLFSVHTLFEAGFTGLNLSAIISDILSYLVMIELFRSFIEYFKTKRIRLHSMIDPAIVFVVRELIVKLYQHDPMTCNSLIQFGILLLCMGVIRTMAVCFSPKGEE